MSWLRLAHKTRTKHMQQHITRTHAHARTRKNMFETSGEEISRIIQEQRALEKRYEELIYARRNMKGFSNRIKFQVRVFITAFY